MAGMDPFVVAVKKSINNILGTIPFPETSAFASDWMI